MNRKIKTIFMGSSDFSVAILEALKNANFIDLILVITNPDKPIGRKQILAPTPVKIFAQKNNIFLIQPANIKDKEFYQKIKNIRPDLIVVAAYGKIIPKSILDIPKYGALNIHPSLLPKWRGPSPIQYTILNNDKDAGVSIILMDEQMDHGPIIASSKFKIQNLKLNSVELSEKLAKIGAQLLIKIIPDWIQEKIKPIPQNDKLATYSKILKKEDGEIDFKKNSAEEIERKIRAFYPWPGVYTKLKFFDKYKLLKIIEAEVYKKNFLKNFKAGQFLVAENKLIVACQKDFLILNKVQLEGKKPVSGIDFYHGYQKYLK